MTVERLQSERVLDELTILVAEDEFLIALDIEAMLRDAGAKVLGPFGTLRQAVAAAREAPFSFAVLDFRLGKDTTRELVDILVARAIPFLFYTGQSLPPGLADALVVAKPASGDAIVDAIAARIDERP
jgi:ActR/RegA family two-component response regulator